MSKKPAALVSVAFAVAVIVVLGGVESEFWRGFWTGITVVATPSLMAMAWLLWVADDEG